MSVEEAMARIMSYGYEVHVGRRQRLYAVMATPIESGDAIEFQSFANTIERAANQVIERIESFHLAARS